MSTRTPITRRGETALCPVCREQAPIHTHRNAKRPVFTDHYGRRFIGVGLYCAGSRGDVKPSDSSEERSWSTRTNNQTEAAMERCEACGGCGEVCARCGLLCEDAHPADPMTPCDKCDGAGEVPSDGV